MTAQFAEWKAYTNPRTNKSGWISAGGMVRYDDPRKKEAEKSAKRTSAKDAFDATRGNGSKIGPEHVEAMRDHLNSLTRDQKRELAKSINAHVGGLKANLVDRLLAYAQGQKQPPYPKKPRSQSLVAIVQGYGGIDPKSYDLQGTYANIKDAINDGINLGVFRKGGNGLDTLAEEMHADGYISVPEGRHPGEFLLEALKTGMKSRHADATDEYEAALQAHYQAEQEAEAYAKGSRARRASVEKAVRDGSEAGRASRRDSADRERSKDAEWAKGSTDPIPFGDGR